MPLTATIIFEGDASVGQKDEVYTMELPYTLEEWKDKLNSRAVIRRNIQELYQYLKDELPKVYLPGEKY